MGFKGEKSFKRPVSSILMFVSSIIAALIGVASLINSIRLFNMSVTSYVGQGYKKADIYKQMVPGSLLPSIFQAIAVYGGIAIVLACASVINTKVSKLLAVQAVNKTEETEKPEVEIVEVENQDSESTESTDNN